MRETSRTMAILLTTMGLILLAATFVIAFFFLINTPSFGELTGALEDIFGKALGPLVDACIKVMYLGVMGWVGSVCLRVGTSTLTATKKERGAAPPPSPRVVPPPPPVPSPPQPYRPPPPQQMPQTRTAAPTPPPPPPTYTQPTQPALQSQPPTERPAQAQPSYGEAQKTGMVGAALDWESIREQKPWLENPISRDVSNTIKAKARGK